MAVGAHVFEHLRAGLIQVEKDVACVAAFGIGPDIDVEAQLIAFAQTAHDRGRAKSCAIHSCFTGAALRVRE